MAGLLLKNISKTYPGEVLAVSNFNLQIIDKEFVVLVGPSGCGKSTTLRMIAGLEGVTEGELYIGDQMVNDVEPGNRDIAMVFQNYALYPHMTVYDNLAFGLKLRKASRKEITQRVDEAARILDISHLLERKPKALSGGERQRVALGRAIIREASVFLLDEPLSNLDAKLRTQMRTEILKLHKKLGTTFIYVTHDQTEAMTMGDRICVMKDGLIQQVDTPQNIYNRPINQFVAGFIGLPQMNFFDATIRQALDTYFLEFKSFGIKLLPEMNKNNLFDRYKDKSVVAGIRPEHVSMEMIKREDVSGNVMTGSVEVTELMGAETYVYLKCGNLSISVRTDSETMVRSGDTVEVTMNLAKMHLFDKETEERLN